MCYFRNSNKFSYIINEGKDIDNFLWEIIKYIKDVLVYKSTKVLNIYNEEEKNKIKELVDIVSKERLLELIYQLSELANNIKWSSQKNIMFQAGMLKACTVIENRVQTVNAQIPVEKKVINEPVMQNKPLNTVPVKPQNSSNMQAAKKVSDGKSVSYWNNVIDKIKQSGKMTIYVNLIGSSAREINDMTVEVELANKNQFAKNILEAYENKSEIEKIISMEANKTMNVRFVSGE